MKKRDVKLQKTPFDTYAFCAILLLASLIFFFLRLILGASTNNARLVVSVFVENQKIDTLNLNEDQTKIYYKEDYPIFLDDITLEIKNGKVRVEKEESPRHYCSIQGFTKNVGQPIVCLPNSFYIVIEAENVETC
ncbi:MAG: NusG domain II-containing protein [Bacilli bacterium]|jgi:hypothetical protein